MNAFCLMAHRKEYWFVAMMSAGLVYAATSFNPDWVNSTTNATQPIGYVGAPAASGYLLTSPQTIFTIDYSSADWSGDMHARTIDSNGTISGVDNWGNGAAYQVDNQNYDTARFIVTWSGSVGIPFRWSSLTPTSQTALGTANVLNFIRGDRSNEGTGAGYRTRGSVLGDMIHSTPLHWDDGTNRTVFVGANDGMLHAFNATNGSERFAFVPSQLVSKLPALTTTPYLHKYFVDGQLAARKYPAFTESGGAARAAKSILVGGLGGGGRGLFALDIGAVPTSESDAAAKVLWEISNLTTGFANLGHTYGTPVLTKLPNGDAALLVGNGYNNTGTGNASLFVINPYTGAKIAELDTGIGSSTSPNGLSSPTVIDANLDGRSDYVYAGDIDGNLWKFDLSNLSSAPIKLFPTATATQTSPAQAITMAPGYINHPMGGYMITLVTGKVFNDDTSGGMSGDSTDTATHYAYGIWDRPTAYAGNDLLLTQTLTEVSYDAVSPSIRTRIASNNTPDWTPGTGHHMGWKTALPVGGERVVGDGAFVSGGAFIFLTSNPAINMTATPPGGNWWMQLNALNGGDNGSVRFDLNADAHFTEADRLSGGAAPVGRYMGGGVRSQMTAFTTAGFDIFQANYDQNGDPPSATSTTERGVSGGHFDVDVYYGTSVTGATTTNGSYQSIKHVHEYDDIFDVTGVNMLDASNAVFDLSNAIPSVATQFKVIASNQYLSPAVKIHLNGSPSYVYNIDQGYIPIKNFITSSTLDVTDNVQVPTYTRATVNSLAINMPVDAFSVKDWWGGTLGLPADARVGLHPTQTGCVKKTSKSSDGGNMYQPVTPPSGVTPDGNGTIPSPRTTGVRHNGALTLQIIKASTPNSAIEMSIPGHPEYGWRVKSASYSTQVLAEYTVFWHEKLIGKCYGESGWSKTAAVDTRACGTSDTATTRKCADNGSAAGGTDPKIGSLGAVTEGTTTTTVTNSDGTTTTTTVVIALNGDGTYTTTTTVTNSGGGSTTTTSTSNSIVVGGAVNSSGVIGGGVTTPLEALGRVNWRELRR